MVSRNLKGRSKNVRHDDPNIIPIIEDVVNTMPGLNKLESRQIVMALAHKTQKVSKSYIARYFHFPFIGAITNAITKVNNRIDIEKDFKMKIDNIRMVIDYRLKSSDMLAKNLEVYNELKNQL